MTTKFDIIKLKAQAALGNAEALYKLGVNYLYGISLDVDIEKAHDFLVNLKFAANPFARTDLIVTRA